MNLCNFRSSFRVLLTSLTGSCKDITIKLRTVIKTPKICMDAKQNRRSIVNEVQRTPLMKLRTYANPKSYSFYILHTLYKIYVDWII